MSKNETNKINFTKLEDVRRQHALNEEAPIITQAKYFDINGEEYVVPLLTTYRNGRSYNTEFTPHSMKSKAAEQAGSQYYLNEYNNSLSETDKVVFTNEDDEQAACILIAYGLGKKSRLLSMDAKTLLGILGDKYDDRLNTRVTSLLQKKKEQNNG